MHDVKWIRENPGLFDEGRALQGLEPLSPVILSLDERRRGLVAKLQAAQERRNAASKEIGQAKAARDEPRAQALMAEVASLKVAMPQDEEALGLVESELYAILNWLVGPPGVPPWPKPGKPAFHRDREPRR